MSSSTPRRDRNEHSSTVEFEETTTKKNSDKTDPSKWKLYVGELPDKTIKKKRRDASRWPQYCILSEDHMRSLTEVLDELRKDDKTEVSLYKNRTRLWIRNFDADGNPIDPKLTAGLPRNQLPLKRKATTISEANKKKRKRNDPPADTNKSASPSRAREARPAAQSSEVARDKESATLPNKEKPASLSLNSSKVTKNRVIRNTPSPNANELVPPSGSREARPTANASEVTRNKENASLPNANQDATAPHIQDESSTIPNSSEDDRENIENVNWNKKTRVVIEDSQSPTDETRPRLSIAEKDKEIRQLKRKRVELKRNLDRANRRGDIYKGRSRVLREERQMLREIAGTVIYCLERAYTQTSDDDRDYLEEARQATDVNEYHALMECGKRKVGDNDDSIDEEEYNVNA
ncbi:uncharacterized protein K452DRAFT_335062 [Aplosporella prunicola CBS 121167]|uniref:Uncharacterized protein n=1 Tax=Aplosporella prunicola CBS 121167 TaxID=1176127 RepID=A0A6A6B9I2_9PEZI|nr:uncharacterized protein K452DRAFT_335062 [Aplosporella prunicola CBS 121167]KAF2140720.1 hypothetical protein K452DRAFT_335062 [Aplosporella prunicola CBS 121167]